MADILRLLEAGAGGKGTVRFIPREPDPRPVADLWRASGAAGRWIAARADSGVVAGVLSSSFAAVVSLLGSWRAGATFASLPAPSRAMAPASYAGQLRRMCAAVDAKVLLVDAAYVRFLRDLPVAVTAFEEVLTGARSAGPHPDRGGGSLVQFTSGSTAGPKGVRLSLDAIGANVAAILERLEVDTGDGCCSWLPLSHDMGLIGMCLSSLAAGKGQVGHASLTLIAPETFLADPTVWLRACAESGATITGAPSFALELVLRRLPQPGSLDLRRLRSLIVGADRVRAQTLRTFETRFAPNRFGPTTFRPAYGLAEAALAVTMLPPSRRWWSRRVQVDQVPPGTSRAAGADPGIEIVSNGPPVPGMLVRVRGESPAAVAPVEVAGPSLLDGYVGGDLELTDGWLATADLGQLVDGELLVLGRTDDVVIVGGRNYHAGELEAAAEHPAIRVGGVAVVAATQGGYATVVEVRHRTPEGDLPAICRELRARQVRRTGAGPSSVVVVAPNELPRTPSGKLQRFRLKAALDADSLPVRARVDFSDLNQ